MGCDCNKKISVRFCPKCKSVSVGYVFGLSSWLGMSPKMRCKNCKIEMPSFPVLETTKRDLDKAVLNLKKKNLKKNVKKKVVKKTKGGKK